MEGGNGATIGSGITQFANGEPKRWNYDTSLILPNRNSITAVHRLEMSLVSGCSDVLFAGADGARRCRIIPA